MTYVRKLLLIDDNPAHAEALRVALFTAKDGPFQLEWVQTLSQSMEQLSEKTIWAVFASLSLPDSQGLDTIDKLLQAAPGIPILVMGRAEDEDLSTEALRRGAKDFLLEGHFDAYSFGRALRNMAERKTAEERLFAEKERASVTLNSIGDAVLSTDIRGRVSYLNVVAERMTGWACAEAFGKPLGEVFQILDGETRKLVPDPLEAAIKENKTVKLTPNCILIRKDGCEAPIEDSAAPIHDRFGSVTGAVVVFHDVTESRAMTVQISHTAQHDILTDLPNRLLLKDRITQAIVAARRNHTTVAVPFVDLDGFKDINDSLGHAVGDGVLQSVAKRLLGCVRSSDTVSRQGGDEFVVLLSEIKQLSGAGTTARKILTAINESFTFEQHDLQLTASIGLSTYPEDGEDAEGLLKHADIAMYEAKKRGHNNYQFYVKDMNARTTEHKWIEADLRGALERQQFVLHYQPKINLETGKITGAEALIRWLHPVRGLLTPLQFIPVAEESGLILPIGQWVLGEACRQTQAWVDAGLPATPIAVNVSSLEFRSEGFLESLRAILNASSLNPKQLELELTESVLMQHAECSASVLTKLKSIGVQQEDDEPARMNIDWDANDSSERNARTRCRLCHRESLNSLPAERIAI